MASKEVEAKAVVTEEVTPVAAATTESKAEPKKKGRGRPKKTEAEKKATEKKAAEKKATKPAAKKTEKKAEKKEAAKTVKTAKKAEKPVAKKTAKKTEKKVEKKETKAAAKQEEIYVQAFGMEYTVEEIKNRVKAVYEAEGHKASSIKSLRLYIKPENKKAYYVINDKAIGDIDL